MSHDPTPHFRLWRWFMISYHIADFELLLRNLMMPLAWITNHYKTSHDLTPHCTLQYNTPFKYLMIFLAWNIHSTMSQTRFRLKHTTVSCKIWRKFPLRAHKNIPLATTSGGSFRLEHTKTYVGNNIWREFPLRAHKNIRWQQHLAGVSA